MSQDNERDPRLIGYLLGELADHELFEKLLAAEEELMYAYVRGRLSSSRRLGFERLFLQTPERKARMVFARESMAYLEAYP